MTGFPGRPLRIGVIDSGWRQWLRDPRVSGGRSFYVGDAHGNIVHSDDVRDAIGHGSRCIRTILAVADLAHVVPIRVFHAALETSPEVLCAALDWARTCDLDIVNLSLSTDRPDARDPLYIRCAQLLRAGTLVVAATTNRTHGGFPAIFDNVIGVTVLNGAAGATERVAAGAQTDVVVAIGCRATTAKNSRIIETTSHATAYVTGHIARALIDAGRRLSLDEVRAALPLIPGVLQPLTGAETS